MSDFQTAFDEAVEQVPAEFRDPSRFVPGVGPLDAEVMVVGEAPGATEVTEGEPFVGRAGAKLDSVLDDVGVDRADLYLTNVVKVRPPENRTPTVAEIEAWLPVLDVEIERVDPAVVVPLGATATEAILDVDEGITAVRGEVFERRGRLVRPTFHPAAMFYDESKQADFEADLRAALEEASNRK